MLKHKQLLRLVLMLLCYCGTSVTYAQHAAHSPIALHHQWSYEYDRLYLHLNWNSEDEADINFILRDSVDGRIIFNWFQEVPDQFYHSKKSVFATFKQRDTILELNQKLTTVNVETNHKGKVYHETWHVQDPAIMYLDESQLVIYPKILLVEKKPTDLYIDITSRTDSTYQISLVHLVTGKKYLQQTDSQSSRVYIDASNLPDGNYDLYVGKTHDRFRIINPTYNVTTTEVSIDWTGVDTNQNIFADMEIDKLSKAGEISMLRMTPQEELEFNTYVQEKNYPQLARQLMYYWVKQGSADWQDLWQVYVQEVNKVHNDYKIDGLSGVQTDRGKTRLRYGEPDEKALADNSPGVYPYEMWIYYPARGKAQKIFLFIRPMFKKDYLKIYDSVEPTEYRWEQMLFREPQNPLNESTEIYRKMKAMMK